MPRSGRYVLSRLGASRPYATPPEIVGRRRWDPAGRCPACRHHAQYAGLAPNGQVEVLDACRHFLRELLVARPTTRPCTAYAARIAPSPSCPTTEPA